jgi:hypothetical protein
MRFDLTPVIQTFGILYNLLSEFQMVISYDQTDHLILVLLCIRWSICTPEYIRFGIQMPLINQSGIQVVVRILNSGIQQNFWQSQEELCIIDRYCVITEQEFRSVSSIIAFPQPTQLVNSSTVTIWLPHFQFRDYFCKRAWPDGRFADSRDWWNREISPYRGSITSNWVFKKLAQSFCLKSYVAHQNWAVNLFSVSWYFFWLRNQMATVFLAITKHFFFS